MKVLNHQQLRAAETAAFQNGRTPDELMIAVGSAAADEIMKRYTVVGKKIIVVCGNGNNGGDGFVVAEKLHAAGAKVQLFLPLGFPQTETALRRFPTVDDLPRIDALADEPDILIDALFGIGLNRAADGAIGECLQQINLMNCIKIAMDLPSGVFCDGGVPGPAFRADLTLTAIAAKPCFFLPPASEYCGEVVVLDVDVPIGAYAFLTLDPPAAPSKRAKNANKGDFGCAMLACGSYGMCGAEILAARGALRTGVGLVCAIVCEKNYTAFCSAVPEAVTLPVPTGNNGGPVLPEVRIPEILKKTDALLIGPGLGLSAESVHLVKNLLMNAEIPTVLDADGINAVCDDISIIKQVKAPLILTPHPGEMARLCQTTSAQIQANRIGYAKKFAEVYNCIVVLKGANTVIAAPDGRIFVNTTGNPGMATGGSGDVLAGMTVALLAQGLSPLAAAKEAVWRHGNAGDRAVAKWGERAVLPEDLIGELASPED